MLLAIKTPRPHLSMSGQQERLQEEGLSPSLQWCSPGGDRGGRGSGMVTKQREQLQVPPGRLELLGAPPELSVPQAHGAQVLPDPEPICSPQGLVCGHRWQHPKSAADIGLSRSSPHSSDLLLQGAQLHTGGSEHPSS